jgi:hypothetical protein
VKRIYVPTTLAVWQRLVTNGSMFQVSGTAFAVTPGESYAEQHNAQSTCSSKACSVPRYKGELRTSPGRIRSGRSPRRWGWLSSLPMVLAVPQHAPAFLLVTARAAAA